MSYHFVVNNWLSTETCCNCGMLFAMPKKIQERLRNDGKTFYCPAGHQQHYVGPTAADKLREENERQRQMLEAAQSRASTAEQSLSQVTKAHRRMRDRVANGVCPCCNRSFGNLRDHMKSEHPDFGTSKTLYAIRSAFGMTQDDVAREAGVYGNHVSLYERNLQVSRHAKERLDRWMNAYAAKEKA